MNGFAATFRKDIFSVEFENNIRALFRTSRILILVDGGISVLPHPLPKTGNEFGISTAFGISTVIATLKNYSGGFSSFDVTVATRDGDGSPIPGHDITGFRFTEASLADFDQAWLFGINPGNILPNETDPAYDSRIEDQPGANPLSDAELAALARWMDKGGGVFATGDHHFLGASMCYRVPRVAVMRRWTIADGVPTMEHSTRLDTNRPANSAQLAGAQQIPNSVETDFVPQRIEWVPQISLQTGLTFVRKRPHPLLCHPTLGPIDILPDHPHEGLCFDFASAAWQAEKRDLTFNFAGYANHHFPTVDGARPLPRVIAWGTTLADPPLDFEKREQPHRRFPQIAAYDGQSIGIGRVVVDSTWHHWFDMNLAGLEVQARNSGDRSDIDRILQYYINVGVYLASPRWRDGQFYGWLKAVQFDYFGQEEADLTGPPLALGRATLAHLKPVFGPCWVSELVLDHLHRFDAVLVRTLREKIRVPDACLSCPPFELFEEAVIGELVRAAYADMTELRTQLATKGRIGGSSLLRDLDRVADGAVRAGVEAAFAFLAEDRAHGDRTLAAFQGKLATAE